MIEIRKHTYDYNNFIFISRKKVVRDLGIIFAYDDAFRAIRLAMNMETYLNYA